MLSFLAESVAEPDADPIWTYFGGPVVFGAVVAGIFSVVKAFVDKKKSPPSITEQTQLLLDGLQSMVAMMTEDRTKDSERISKYQQRIEELESSAVKDYEMISRLQEEQHDLQSELMRRSRMISELVAKLNELSIIVEGLEASYSHTLTFKEKVND